MLSPLAYILDAGLEDALADLACSTWTTDVEQPSTQLVQDLRKTLRSAGRPTGEEMLRHA